MKCVPVRLVGDSETMFSLQQLFGKGDKFFELLESAAQEALSSVQALVRLVSAKSNEHSMEEFVLSRRKEKKITEQISEELVKTFVTGLEREDIEALSVALYKIPKATEKFAERYVIASPHLSGLEFSKQAVMLEQACQTVLAMVKQLRSIQELEKIKDQNARLQYLEGQADELILDSLGQLYSGKHEALKVIVVKDLYELMEKIIDRCRDAGNVVSHIVLKNS